MASFFQFPDQQPLANRSGPALVLPNRSASPQNLLNSPPQIAALVIGAASLFFAFTLALVPRLGQPWSALRKLFARSPPPSRPSSALSKAESTFRRRSKLRLSGALNDHAHGLVNTTAFHVHNFSEASGNHSGGLKPAAYRAAHSIVHFTIPHREKGTKNLSFSSVDLEYFSSLPSTAASESTLDVSILGNSALSSGFDGVVLSHHEDSEIERAVENVLNLADRRIPVVLKADADSVILDHVDLALVDGLLLENACTWPSGERRDFFRASRVRQSASRCKQQRETRPGFFFGFVERWVEAPSAAVLRRAFKLADFLGAMMDAEHAHPPPTNDPRRTVKAPLSGFDWLKRAEVVRVQASWSRKTNFMLDALSPRVPFNVRPLVEILPQAGRLLSMRPVTVETSATRAENISSLSIPSYESPTRYNIWDFSSCNAELSPEGFFGIRDEVTKAQYRKIVAIQRDLRRQRLLRRYDDSDTRRILAALEPLKDRTAYHKLFEKLSDGLVAKNIRLLAGLDSGFQLPDEKGHFWAVTDMDTDKETVELDVYLSQKVGSEAAALWHAFLAHHRVPRLQRFEEELHLSKKPNDDKKKASLPNSIERELYSSSEAELLYLIQQIAASPEHHPFCSAMTELAEEILVRDTSMEIWKLRHSRACLDGSESTRDLLDARLQWFRRAGAATLPSLDNLATLATMLDREIRQALMESDLETLQRITQPLVEAYDTPSASVVSPAADLFGLAFFCSVRNAAYENTYLDTTDRCPFFLSQPDQAAVFAELWVLGSQCEIYFGLPPRALGEIIYTQYREHLTRNPPPEDAWDGKNEFNAYFAPPVAEQTFRPMVIAGSGSGLAPTGRISNIAEDSRQSFARFSAISIFCVPAIIDVLLLAFLGRGLYVTAFMEQDIKLVANYAILTALLLTGGVTGFIGSAGGFYLHNDATDNLTHFLVQRFSASMMLSLAVALCGLIGFGVRVSWYAGAMYFLYLLPPSIFLTMLATFATMYRPDSPLPSGRTAMWQCLPILFISPLLTTFVHGWDLLIYQLVIWAFGIALLLKFRGLCQSWTNWVAQVPQIKDADVVRWYRESGEDPPEGTDAQVSEMAQGALRRAIAEDGGIWNRLPMRKRSSSQKFVSKLAQGMPLATFLLKKQSAEGPLPEPFSSAWYTQLKLALDAQQHLKRGLKEHSAFINYRYARYDIAQSVGLFLLALLDRLVDIVMSARTPAPPTSPGPEWRYALCFALLHFLCGALSVDVTLSHYWAAVAKLSSQKLSNCDDIRERLEANEKRHRKLYRTGLRQLGALFTTHLGVFSIIVWLLVEQREPLVLFFCYAMNYTAVLLCQFNRCFTKSHRLHVTLVLWSCVVGFVIGCILRAVPSSAALAYDFVIGQAVAALSAVFGTSLLTMDRTSSSLPQHSKAELEESSNENHRSETPHYGLSGMPGSCTSRHRFNRRMLNHLCLGIDLNTEWRKLDEDTRKFLTHRVKRNVSDTKISQASLTKARALRIEHHNAEIARLCNAHPGDNADAKGAVRNSTDTSRSHTDLLTTRIPDPRRSPTWTAWLLHVAAEVADMTVKWMALLSEGAPNAPRELWYTLREWRARRPLVFLLLAIWRVCWWSRISCVYIFIIARKPDLAPTIRMLDKQSRSILRQDRVIVDSPDMKMTGIFLRDPESHLAVMYYEGVHKAQVHGLRPVATALYDTECRLTKRLLTGDPSKPPVDVRYEYNSQATHRLPMCKTTRIGNIDLKDFYDTLGRPVKGRTLKDGTEYEYVYTYAYAKKDANVVAATYRSVAADSDFVIKLFWCDRPSMRPDDQEAWIPSKKIHAAEFTMGGLAFEVLWKYKHTRDASVEASVFDAKGQRQVAAPPLWLTDDKQGWLKKPKDLGFDYDDLLILHSKSSLRSIGKRTSNSDSPLLAPSAPGKLARFLGLGRRVVQTRIPTSDLRTALWSAWGKAPFLDAPSACYIDEMILRSEPLLRPYWRLRDRGSLAKASMWLDEHLESVAPAIEPLLEASQSCPLLIKTTDLFAMGLGKAAPQLTGRPDDAYQDTNTTTSVIFSDNGCWPDNPGGVSNCRRDLVNGHTSIRGHCLAESANEYGIPRYQIERNINSLKILPLWGLDRQTAHHGVFDNLLESQVDEKMTMASDENIARLFVPLMKTFVRGARSKRHSRVDLVKYSNTILQMNRYFEECDFTKTWRSQIVWKAWLGAWLIDYNDANVLNFADCFELEKPSLNDFRDALNLYIAYFFMYSVDLPTQEDCPGVFQSTHHGISSLFGMLLKYRRGTTWGLWDHAILWRETCLNISPAQCLLPLAVQSMLLKGIGLACHLAYTHVDIVLPCTSLFNPDWEAALAMDDGRRGSVKTVHRKIDPIVNGIGDMTAFKPIEETRSKLPTAVMLSNVQFIKDVKAAVYAADVIVNVYGFKDYRLLVYGAQDRQPAYAHETAKLIILKGLSNNVKLAGFGSPKEVLKDAWIFMNSSLSEGLPLAIGEAALSGVPIVATEVGATALVLTDPDDASKRYGEVVPPNDPVALARAQLSILAMMGPWAQYTASGEAADLPNTFTREAIASITQRMHEKGADRRALGMKLREVVLRGFHGHRYLREHEQMYWVQRRRAEIRRREQDEGHNAALVELPSQPKTFAFQAAEEKRRAGRWWLKDQKAARKGNGSV